MGCDEIFWKSMMNWKWPVSKNELLKGATYEVRSETKLVFRLVEPLFRFVSLSTEFVASTFQVESSWTAPIRLVVTEFVSSTPQIDSSFFYLTRGYRVRLVDSWDRPIMHDFLFDSSSVEFDSSTHEIDSSWADIAARDWVWVPVSIKHGLWTGGLQTADWV